MNDQVGVSLHEALSILSDETHAAAVFMLEKNCNVRISGPCVSSIAEIEGALRTIFGDAAQVLIQRMAESKQEKSINLKQVCL
jgi:hypothetical protein